MSEQISFTYNNTAGHSGTDTSYRQATDRATHSATQQRVLASLIVAGRNGLTIVELRSIHPDLHHGQLSSALTNLHRDGKVARLAEKRGRAKVYVTVASVAGRETELPKQRRTHVECPNCGQAVPL